MPLPMSFDDSLDISDPEVMKELHKSEQIIRETKPIITFSVFAILLHVALIAFLALKVDYNFGCSIIMMFLSLVSFCLQYLLAHYTYKRKRNKLKITNIVSTIHSGISIITYISIFYYSCTIYNTYVLFYYYVIVILQIVLTILTMCCQRRMCVEVVNQLGPIRIA